jgi:CII-binding regulator of phage lambda lysogenization HflD
MIKDIKSYLNRILILNKKIIKNKNINNKMNNKINIMINNNNKNKKNMRQNPSEEVSIKVTKLFMTHENFYFNRIYLIFYYQFI